MTSSLKPPTLIIEKRGQKSLTELRAKYVCGKLGKIIPARLLPGTDLMNGLKKVCGDNKVRHGTVLTAIGSLRKLTIQLPVPNEKTKLGVTYSEPQVISGPIEVLGIQGVILETEAGEVALHLHGTFSGKDGKVYGGHLVPDGNPILVTLDAVIGEVTDARLMRRYDEEIDFNVFSPEPL